MLPLTNHARLEIQRRGIGEALVFSVFEKPQQKIELDSGREIWQSRVIMDGKEYVVRLVIETEPALKIITVYRSSKVSKYWRQ